eukprot:m.56650 g.56650  ORF g.56650 m.56650 type:complete len:291 (-) comp13406_c0_seq1:110-982(-)
MVVLNIKRGDEPQFLFETTTDKQMAEIVAAVAKIYNDRLRIDRLAMEMEQLAEHGIMVQPDMMGLTEDQISDLKLKDEWSARVYPMGGSRSNPDPIGRRTGNAPTEKLAEVLKKTAHEARELVSKKLVAANVCLTQAVVDEAFSKCKGAVMIVYPMGLPPHDEVKAMLDDTEDLSGKQAKHEVIPVSEAQLWWAGKELQAGKKLGDIVGRNEKTKIIAKIQKKGQGAPSREPMVDTETQKQMMAHAYKKQEEWKKLEEAQDEDYLNSPWANTSALKSQLQGTAGISWKPR